MLNAVISAFCFTCHTCKFYSYLIRNWIQSSALYEWLNSPTLLNFWCTEYSQSLYGAVGEWVVIYIPGGGGGTSLCWVHGYVPPTRVNFSLPKIQNRPQILRFYSRTGPTFWHFTPEQDPFFTIWSQMPGSNVKIPVAFNFCFLQPDVFTFVLLYMSKCFKLFITGISLS